MAEWPATLPSYLLVDGFSEGLPDNLISSQMDVGPPKARRRSTAGIVPIRGRVLLSMTLVSTFVTFYRATLEDGALTFTWIHPRTGDSVTMRFASPPVITPVGGTEFYVDMDLVIMP